MAGDVLQHIATKYVVLAERRMHIALQRRAQCTVEEAISELLPMLAKDPNTFVDDVFEVMRVVLDMQIRLTRRNIHIKDGGLHNLGFMGNIEKARLKTCSRTPWIDFEHCCALPKESKPRRKHVNQVVWSMLGGVCVSLSPDTLGAKLAGPLQRYGWSTWQELGDHLIYDSHDLDWIQQYLRELKKSVSAAVGLDDLAPPCRVTLRRFFAAARRFFAAARRSTVRILKSTLGRFNMVDGFPKA